MPLKGQAKRDYQKAYMRVVRQATRPHRGLSALNMEVLRLALGHFTAQEIADLLGISEGAAFKAFERVAEFLAPTPASKLSINPCDCLPFSEEIFEGEAM